MTIFFDRKSSFHLSIFERLSKQKVITAHGVQEPFSVADLADRRHVSIEPAFFVTTGRTGKS